METTSTLKILVQSARQYRNNAAKENLLTLVTNLDGFVTLTENMDCTVFEPKVLLTSEGMNCFNELLLVHHSDPVIPNKVLCILQNLAKDKASQLILKSEIFDWFASLTLFLDGRGMSVSDPVVIQCLTLLEIMTEDIEILYLAYHMEQFITFLTIEINNDSVEVEKSALLILANLCRCNKIVREYMAEKNMKNILKSLVEKLCSPEGSIIMYSLSIIANLSGVYSKCEKLFSRVQMKDALELIVIYLISEDECSSKAALNLFCDLLKRPPTMEFYSKYDKFRPALKRVMDVFGEKQIKEDHSARVLKFVWLIVDSYPNIESLISIFTPNDDLHPALNSGISSITDSSSETCVFAIKIVCALANNCTDDDWKFLEVCFQPMIPELFHCSLLRYKNVLKANSIKEQLEIQLKTYELILTLMSRDRLRGTIIETLNDMELFQNIVSQQLLENCLSSDSDWCDVGAELVITVLRFVVELSCHMDTALSFVQEMLKKPSLMPFLVHNLNSKDSYRIKKTFTIIFKIHSKASMDMLIESFVSYGSSDESVTSESFSDGCSIESLFARNESLLKEVEVIVQAINDGMNLDELEQSEILQLFNFEINSLKAQEKSLTKVIEAKTAALKEANDAFNCFKLKQAKCDIETMKLRQQLIQAVAVREESQKQVKEEQAKTLHWEKLSIEGTQSLQASITKVNELEEMITSLKDKLEKSSMELESKSQLFSQVVDDKQKIIRDLSSELQAEKLLLDAKSHECEELELSNEELKKVVTEKEVALQQLSHDVKILEKLRHRHEATIREKNELLNNISDELEKQKQITDMIHKMSAGT